MRCSIIKYNFTIFFVLAPSHHAQKNWIIIVARKTPSDFIGKAENQVSKDIHTQQSINFCWRDTVVLFTRIITYKNTHEWAVENFLSDCFCARWIFRTSKSRTWVHILSFLNFSTLFCFIILICTVISFQTNHNVMIKKWKSTQRNSYGLMWWR